MLIMASCIFLKMELFRIVATLQTAQDLPLKILQMVRTSLLLVLKVYQQQMLGILDKAPLLTRHHQVFNL